MRESAKETRLTYLNDTERREELKKTQWNKGADGHRCGSSVTLRSPRHREPDDDFRHGSGSTSIASDVWKTSLSGRNETHDGATLAAMGGCCAKRDDASWKRETRRVRCTLQ